MSITSGELAHVLKHLLGVTYGLVISRGKQLRAHDLLSKHGSGPSPTRMTISDAVNWVLAISLAPGRGDPHEGVARAVRKVLALRADAGARLAPPSFRDLGFVSAPSAGKAFEQMLAAMASGQIPAGSDCKVTIESTGLGFAIILRPPGPYVISAAVWSNRREGKPPPVERQITLNTDALRSIAKAVA